MSQPEIWQQDNMTFKSMLTSRTWYACCYCSRMRLVGRAWEHERAKEKCDAIYNVVGMYALSVPEARWYYSPWLVETENQGNSEKCSKVIRVFQKCWPRRCPRWRSRQWKRNKRMVDRAFCQSFASRLPIPSANVSKRHRCTNVACPVCGWRRIWLCCGTASFGKTTYTYVCV